MPQHTMSELKINNFRRAGFPESFCETLEYELPLLLGGNPFRRLVLNHVSAVLHEHRDFVESTLAKWEHMGVIMYVQQRPYIVNPLSVVVSGQKKRLVLDARSSGLNDFIIAPKFALPNIGSMFQRLRSGDYMMKLDLASGFLQLLIWKVEQTFLKFQSPTDNRFGVFQRLSFGLRSAPFLFSTFTYAIKQAVKENLNIKTEVYIDDWFLSGTSAH